MAPVGVCATASAAKEEAAAKRPGAPRSVRASGRMSLCALLEDALPLDVGLEAGFTTLLKRSLVSSESGRGDR